MVPLIQTKTPREGLPTLRVRFQKVGRLSYISHLDLLRTVQKAILRADLPLYYTEGFSPKPKLSFATPLSLGQESIAELLDIRLTRELSLDDAMARLSSELPPELAPLEVGYPGAPFSAIAYSSYEMTLEAETLTEGCDGRALALLTSSPLVVFKRSKSGDKDTDISGAVRSVKADFDGKRLTLALLLAADNAGFLNPDYLLKILKKEGFLPEDPMSRRTRILRTALFDAEGAPLL